MNKIFKVVWNRTIGSFVVTSELAKGRVKSSSEGAEGDVRASEEGRLKTLFRLTALSAALLGFSEGAWAAIPEKTPTGGAIFAIGTGTTSANGAGSISIGHNAQAKINGGLAIAPNSTHTTISNGNNAIAIGVNLRADGTKAIGIGADTTVNGTGAIAIGNNDSSRMANQGVNGNGAIGVGSNLTARGNNAIAVGTESQATANHAIAIGTGTRAMGEDSIAIGRSEGTKLTRADNKQSVAIGWTAQATGATQAVAIGPDAIASGTQSTSIGNNTRATGDSSIAIGGDDWNIVRTKQVAAAGNKLVHQVFQDLTGMPMKQQGEAYGNPFKGTTAGDAAVAIGVAALAEGALSTAFGSGTSASGVGAAAFGVGATASQNKSVAIGAGSHTNTDATAVTTATVNGITYGGFAGTTHITPGSQVSFGSAGFERQLKHVAPGAITSTSTDAINGSQLYALHAGSGNIAKAVANALGGGAAVGIDPTNNQGTVTLPSYDVFKGNATPNATGNSTTKFNTAAATSVGGALTNLNTYVNQGFAVKDNAGAAKGIVTPGESVQFADGNATTVTVDTEANGNTKIKYDVKVDDSTIKVVDGKLTGASQTHFYSVKNEDQTKGNYNNNGATGDNALAAGVDASATANGTTAVGLKAQASAESAIAVGSETKAAAKNAVVIGNKASVEAATGSVANVNGTTTGEGSVAVGAASKASGTNATAVGQAANAYGQNSFAGGQVSNAKGKSSVAVGDGANALNDSAVALGAYTTASNVGSTAVGFGSNALGWASFAGGHSAKAEASSAVALGHEAQAVGSKAVAIGKSSHAAKESGIALGDGAKAAEVNAIAIGSTNNAWKEDSIALGRLANADGAASLALGLNSHTRLENAIALGNGANADYSNSIAIGKSSHAAESAGVAIGNDAQALKYSSVVIGDQARSNNSRSVVIGYHASATNPAKPASAETDYNQTVAIGAYANAWGDQSTAIGNNVDAKGNSSIAIGADDWDTVAVKTVDGTGKTVKEVYQDYTGDVMATGKDSYTHTTSGEAAVAIGTKSQAIGELSTAFGTGTIAEGVASAAFGMGAKATKGNSVAIGAGSTTTTNAISVNEATVNNLKYSGFAGGNNVTSGDQVSFGSKNYERQLKNVAPGEISNTSTDAINGSQLYAVQNVLGNTAKTVKNVLGGNAAVGEDGGFTMSNIGGTGKNTIDEAIRDLNANAYKPFKLTTAKTANTNGTVQDDSLQNITSGSTITLEAGKNIALRQNGATVSINTVDNPEFAGKVTAKGGLDMGGNKITNVAKGDTAGDAVNLEQLQDAMANLRVSTLTTVNNDAPFSYVGTDGRILRREVTVAPGTGVKTVSFKHMDDNTEYTGDVTIAALNPTDPQTTTPTTVGNVKNGAKDNDAVNVSQLNKIADAIGTKVNPDGTITAPTYSVISGDPSTSSVAGYNKVGDALTALSNAVRTPLNFEGDTGTKFDRQLGSTVAVKGGQNNADKLSENNIGVVADKNSGTLNVKLAKELTGLTSAAFSGNVTTAGTTVNGSGVTIGSGSNPVSLTAGGLSNGGNKVTNIADGAVDTDAASYKQVKAAKTEVQGGTNVASVTKTDSPTDGHTVYTVNAKGAAVALDSSVDGLKLTSSEDTTTNVTTYKLDLSDKTKASLTKADSALQNIGVQVNGTDAKTLTKDDSTLNFVNGTGTTAENKNGTVAFNVNKSTLTAGTDGTVNAGKAGDAFATAADVAQAINEAVANSEKTSAVEKGDNTHVTAVETGNKTTYTVHADNTTVSVKDGGKLKLESSEKANANQTKTTNYELDLTDAAKAEIQKGVEAKNIVDTKGITFSGNSGSPVTKKLDETLAIKGDNKNVETEAGTDGIKVKLKDEITLTSVTANTLKAGDSVLTNDGLNIANGTAGSTVSLTKSGLNNGGNKITKVAKGENEDDAVNYAQLKELAEKGLTFDADGNTSTSSKKLGERVGIKGGNNITTSADNDNVTVKLNDDITLNSVTATTLKAGGSTLTNAGLVTPKVTAGNSVLEDNGLTISNGAANAPVSLTKNGLDNGNNKIAKVAKGTEETDGVNVSQIKPLAEALNTTVGADGTVGQPSFTVKQADGTAGTAVHTVQDALNKVSDELNKGLTIAADNGNADKVNLGETVTYTSKDKNIVTTVGSNEIDFSLANTVTVGKNAAGGNPVTIDGTNGTVSGLTNKTLGGTNFAAKGQAATEEQINAAQTNLANVLGTGSTNQNGTVTVTDIGETGKTTVSDAIKSVKETAEKGWNLQANGDTAEKVAAGETVTFKDGKNIKVTRNGKNITVATSDDVEFNKVTVGDSELNGSGLTISNGAAGSSVSLTKNGLNNGGNKITKVAEGALTADSTDAVNGAQLYKVDQKADTNAANIAKGINIGGTSNSKKYALGDTVNIKGDSNITSETVEGGVQLKLADTVKIGQDTGKPVSIDGTTGTVSGLSNTTLGGTGFATSNKAATEAQLDATQANLKTILGGKAANNNGNVTTSNIGETGADNVHDAIKSVKETAEKGWKLKVNEETSAQAEKISPDDEVAIKQGKNITVTREGKNITVATSDDVAFNKVTVGDSVLNSNGLTITNGAANAPVSLTKNGLDNGGNKIAKVAKGTADTDAVNVEQLKPIAAALNTTVNPTTGEVAAPAFTVTKADGTKNTAVGTVQEALDKVGEELKKGLVIAADEGSSEKVNLGETVTYTGTDGNIKTKTLPGGKVDFGLNDKVTLGKAGGTPIVLDGTNGTVSGLTNKTLGGTDFATKGQAATEEQLNASQVNLKTILGGNAENTNGNIAMSNIGGTNQNTVHDAIKSVKETAEKGWKLKVNEETSSEKISPDDEVAIKEGKNIKVTRDGKNITVATSDDVEFNAVNATNVIAETVIAGNSVLTTEGLKIGADNSPSQVSLTTAGLSNGGNKIAKVAKGTEDTDGVNVSQIKPLATALNTTVDTDGSIAAPNFTVKHADGTEGTPVHTVQDALDKVGEEVTKGINVGGTTGSNKYALGGTINIKGDSNIVSDTVEGGVQLKLADTVKIGQDSGKPVSIDGTTGTVSGLSNTTLGAAPLAGSNKAATEAQLDATQVNLATILGGNAANNNGNVTTNNIGDTGANNVHDAIKSVKETAEKGWNLKANEETDSEKIAAGDTVTVKQGKNIRVKRSGKELTVETEDDVAFNKVTVGNSELTTTGLTTPKVTAGDSVLTTDGLTIANGANPVSLTKSGLNNGGNKIANVAKGTEDTDGVNVSQIKPLATALNTTVGADGSIAEPNFTVNHADGTAGTPVHTVQDALNEVGKELNKGLNIVADNGSSEKVNLGDTVTYTSKDKNIVTTSGTGKAIDFSLAEKVTIGKDAANGGKPVVIDGKEGIVSGLTNTTLGSAPLAGSNKAATEAQLDATQVNLATILGGNAANNNGNVTTNNIGGTGKDNVHEAIAAVKETADKGWNLKANDETDSEKIAAGDTVTVKQGKNIRVKRSGKDLTVETEDDVEFAHVKADSVEATSVVAESVIAGNSVLTTDGLKIGADGSPSQVSLTTSGLNNGGNKIANVAKGVADTDAVNVSQLNPIAKALNSSINPITGAIEAPVFTVTKADGTKHEAVGTVQDALDKVGEEVSKGLNIVADNGSSEKVNLGDTVTYTSKDKNIVTTSGTGKAIDFSLAEKVTIGKDAANGGKPVVIDGKEGIVSGLTNTTLGSAPLAGSNKAATEAQLDATQVNLKTILGGEAKNENGNVSTANIGGTGKDNVHEAIAAVKETADKGWNLKANDETDSEKIAAGDTVTVKQGKNIRVKRSGKELTVETSDDVEFAHVKADSVEATSVVAESVIAGNSVLTTEGLKIGADGSPSQVSLTTAGLNNGGNKIANVAKGTDDTDAVNVAQLNEQLAATEKTTTVVAGKNVTVSEKVDGNNTEYTVNADKTTLSQAANGAVKVSEGAKDADGVTDYALDLTDETKADIAKGVAAKDAVDNKGLTFAADNGTTGAKKLGDSLSVKGDGNILTRADENGIGFSLADKITVGKAGNGNKPLVIDGTAGLISGLSNTTLGGADFATKGQAASEEQLNAAQANLANLLGGNAANDKGNVTTTDIGGTGKDNVHDAIAAVKETADKGWNLNANDETSSEKIGAGDTVTFKEGKNVKVSRNGKHITVATSDDVSFDKVTVGDSVLTDNGLTVGNGKAGKPVSLTKDGLNNGGNKVSDIAAGEADTDAVNVAQLKAAAAKATSKVDSGNDNIVVTPEQNADGSTTYKVATAPNLKADSFTAGDTVVNNDGVKVGDKVALGKDGLKAGDVNITADGINAGNKAISNVAEGKKDTDAVNVGQLNRLTAAAKTEVEAGTNIASVSSKQGANGQTVYTVNADGASVSAGSDNIVVTKGNKDANNVTDYAVDLSKAVKADIAKGVAAKDAVDNKGISFAGDSGTTVANKLGDTVAVKGDANITTTAGANGIQVGLNKDLKVDSVKAGDTVVNNNGVNVGDKVALGKDGLKAGDVNITADGINAGGKKVTGVAAGTVAAGSTDAVNGGQLHQVYELIGSNGGNVNTAPPSVEADGKAGLGNIKNITLVDNSNNPNVTNVTNETKIAQSNGYSLVTYNVEDQGMYVTNNVIEAVGRMNEQGIKFFHTNDGEVNPDVQARNSEDSSASGAYATAVGFQAVSKGTNAIAIGKGAKANAENTIAIGTGNIVSGKNSGAIGDPTVVSGNSSYSIGNNNNVSADNAYALGSNIKATVNDSVYLGDRAQTQGIHTADAAKGEAYTYGGLNDKAVAGKAGSAAAANKVAGVVTVGNGTDETRQVQGVAAGVVSADSTDAINGSQLYYTNQAIANVATQATAAKTEVTAGKNVVVNQTTGNSGQTVYNVATADKLDVASVTAGGVTVNAQGVSIAAPTAHNPANTVSLSPIGLNNGGQRITNVAPAKEGTDAVNLNQLAGVGNALQNNIERVGKKAYAGVAGAIAQGSIPQVTRPGATGIGVGSGYYGGQSAMAIGVSAMSDGGNWVVKGNFSANTDGHVGVGAGALYQW
ncbi:hypothetical protein A6J88_04815 [Neisseria mucosa]|uniref:YadA-like family protein n=11 Tax=Neisseria TaxID=482 RepID=A0ABN4Y8C2_NEIMU|nr:YadA-like family protein [Neisseria mucosa]ARC50658.1 hypothetical protein A6J88_04815 [Neisseria mucosa]